MLPPHCFGIADQAYDAIIAGGGDQSLVICGESGAGKTETTKLMLKYLSQVASSGGGAGGVVPIEAQIMQSNPLMEAFGNAKTLRNDNSRFVREASACACACRSQGCCGSRFGKFIRVQFDDKIIVGASITNYLLEKPRIVTQPADERNYHVFYQVRRYPLCTPPACGCRLSPLRYPVPHVCSCFEGCRMWIAKLWACGGCHWTTWHRSTT